MARSRGRPTEYKSEYAEQAYKLCLLGAIDREIADFFGVSEKTLNNWKQKHPDFLQSIKEGKEEADAKVAKSLYHRAIGYQHEAIKILQHNGEVIQVPYIEHHPPDTTACIFWLKNRQPKLWRDKVEQEISGPDGGPIGVVVLPAADLGEFPRGEGSDSD